MTMNDGAARIDSQMLTIPSMELEYEKLLRQKVFVSEKERAAFIDKLSNNILELPERDIETPKGKAIALVIAAKTVEVEEGFELAKKALSIDPECIDAYEFLGLEEEDDHKSIAYYKDGIKIGRRLFSGEYLNSNRGLFCSIPETRAYMKCLSGYSSVLFSLRMFEHAIQVYETILSLDIRDLMSVRHELMLALIRTGDIKRFRKYEKRYHDDPAIYMHFNRVLFSYMTTGDSETTNNLLNLAVARNRLVVPVLITLNKPRVLPQLDQGEFSWAFGYSLIAKDTWIEVRGALSWLRSKHNTNDSEP